MLKNNRGKFIVFEGIDGSGKSTQAVLAKEYLEFLGKKVYLTREPSSRPIGKLIRQALTKQFEISEASIAALFLADRLDHIQNQDDGILKFLDEGYFVISDRYFWSSFAYHSLSLPMDWVIGLHEKVFELCPPDLTLFLEISAEDSLKRVDAREGERELFEQKEILSKVENNYNKAFESLNDRFIIEKINARQDIMTISAQIKDQLKALV